MEDMPNLEDETNSIHSLPYLDVVTQLVDFV